MPGVYEGDDGRPGPVLRTFEVDGERFDMSRTLDGSTHYDWVSGPNSGYGFSVSGPEMTEEDHAESIRNFLSMIDFKTGYIAEQ